MAAYKHNCPCCGEFSALSVSSTLTHIRLAHSDDPGFQLSCNFEGCSRTFRQFTTYRNHLYSIHPNIFRTPSSSEVVSRGGLSSGPDSSSNDDHDPNPEDMLDVCDADVHDDPKITEESIKRAVATWILKVRERYTLTQVAVERIIQDLDSLFEISLQDLHEKISKCLQHAGVSTSVCTEVDSIFRNRSSMFDGLSTHHLQMAYFKHHFPFVVGNIKSTIME